MGWGTKTVGKGCGGSYFWVRGWGVLDGYLLRMYCVYRDSGDERRDMNPHDVRRLLCILLIRCERVDGISRDKESLLSSSQLGRFLSTSAFVDVLWL